jgi:hypothetical protein
LFPLDHARDAFGFVAPAAEESQARQAESFNLVLEDVGAEEFATAVRILKNQSTLKAIRMKPEALNRQRPSVSTSVTNDVLVV